MLECARAEGILGNASRRHYKLGGPRGSAGEVENFAGVQDAVGIEGELDGPHHVDVLGRDDQRHVLFAFVADAVLAGNLAAHVVGGPVHVGQDFGQGFSPLVFGPFGVHHGGGEQVAVAGKNVATAVDKIAVKASLQAGVEVAGAKLITDKTTLGMK